MISRIMYNKYRCLFFQKGKDDRMTIEAIFNHINCNYKITLQDKRHKSISLILEKPFYVQPAFKTYNEDSNPRIVLFSAPGATGKSALAKYIASMYSSLYWNLADIHLGESTYDGTLINALGASNYSSYIEALNENQTLLVVDAFDESEVNSGENMIRTLIHDIDNSMKECTKPYTAFFSRTETAQTIGMFLKDKQIPYLHYEIGLFTEHQAKIFVKEYIKSIRNVCTNTQEMAIDAFFVKIKQVLESEKEYQDFIGYAPVLQSIALSIISTENTMTILNGLSNTKSVGIICKIMVDLIVRESQKFKTAFETSVDGSLKEVVEGLSVYSATEQYLRCLLYILELPIKYDDYIVENMPLQAVNMYEEKINVFLPQHTFVMNTMNDKRKTFVGPAFRDFVIANIFLENEFYEFANEYINNCVSESHFPSQLFWDFYIDGCGGEAPLAHIPYLYESYKSRNKVNEYATLHITVHDNHGTAVFETYDIGSRESIDEYEINLTNLDELISFSRLQGVFIEGSIDVELRSNSVFVVNGSSIDCRRIYIDTPQLEISCPHGSISYFISEENVTLRRSPKVNFHVEGQFKAAFPNIFSLHAFIPYRFEGDLDSQYSFESFVYSLKKIFSYFRQHKKDTLGKDAEKIDFHVLKNSSEVCKKVFEYLLHIGVIYKDAHLYKIDKEKMKENGISWVLESDNLYALYTIFESYCASN